MYVYTVKQSYKGKPLCQDMLKKEGVRGQKVVLVTQDHREESSADSLVSITPSNHVDSLRAAPRLR